MRQIVASALYVQNWALAHDAEDYFASSNSPSPVTHYWSLSLEEQFYLLWPVLAVVAYVVGRRLGRPRTALALAFGAVVVASLGYSIWETARLPHAAYFVTPARMWQLGLGGLLAMLPAAVRARSEAVRHAGAAAGWLLVFGSIALFTESSPVPGWIALIPVLGAALVIFCGDAFVAASPAVLQVPVRVSAWIGGISYSLYLWHWPLIVLTPYATGRPLTPATKLVVLAAAVLCAWLSARLVEDPVRRLRWLTAGKARRTLVPALAGMLVVVGFGQLSTAGVDARLHRVAAAVDNAVADGDRCFGARAIGNDCASPHLLRYRDAPLLRMSNYSTGGPSWGNSCQQNPTDSAVVACQYGVPAEDATLRIAVVGDSHARHWTGALDELAVRRRWNITLMAKSSCTVTAAAVSAAWDPTIADSCHAWLRRVIPRVARDPDIDVVVTSAISRSYLLPGVPRREQLRRQIAGYRQVWRRWTRAGKRVVAIGDVPAMGLGDIPTCVAEAGSFDDPCTTPVATALRADPLLRAARGAHDADIVPVGLHRYFCDRRRCHSVIGGVVAYGDGSHMLAFFSRTLAPYLLAQMRPALRDER
ncbi:MAG: acyltransferase family protein [Nocardioides sp.]|uniref:acyltransferase family protein n=1 Tax=Nocardioides sp. TaxID=35761 RepID=UPI0039E4A983